MSSRSRRGVAVVAEHFWAARSSDATRSTVEWDPGPGAAARHRGAARSSTARWRRRRALSARKAGDAGRRAGEGGEGHRGRVRRCRTSPTRRWSRSTAPSEVGARIAARSGRARSSRPSTSRRRPRIAGLKPEQVEHPHDLPGRRRSAGARPRPRDFVREAVARREGGRRAGQGRVDARGRHARRLLPAAVLPPRAGAALDATGAPRRVAPHDRRPVVPRRHAVRGA